MLAHNPDISTGNTCANLFLQSYGDAKLNFDVSLENAFALTAQCAALLEKSAPKIHFILNDS